MNKKLTVKKLLAVVLLISLVMSGISVNKAEAAATGVPAKLQLSHNQWPGDGDGDYDITGNMWYGTNGTSYILYESYGNENNFKAIAEGKLIDNTPNAQSFVYPIKNKTVNGTYYYYAELKNSYGSTKSNVINLKVNVAGGTTQPTPVPSTPTPKPSTPTPKPSTPTPKPSTPTPKPSTPTPKPSTPTPVPVTPTPVPTTKPTAEPGEIATGVPGKAMLQHNQWGNDRDGQYDITVNMWYGNNGTSYKLYERIGIKGDFKVVAEGKLKDATPSVQSFVINITGRKTPGTYYYYAELINSHGSTKGDTINLQVGSGESSKIVIDKIDDEKTEIQYTMSQGKYTFDLEQVDAVSPEFTVISNNTSVVKASITSGNKLQIEAVAAGRSGLKIVEKTTKEERYIGIRVKNTDGSLPGLPEYVSIGQVSEDIAGDLKFWKDTDTDDTNKRCDIRYIYINGGPTSGWRTWTSEDGARAKTYITESLKMGMIPYFVYYNIPDAAEDYAIDLKHINDKSYMEAYYKDLQFFLDICNEYAGDEMVGIVLEPDFLGYMMQQSGKSPTQIEAAGVEGVYSSGVLTKGKDPDFKNTVTGVVESINYIISTKCPTAHFGWQFNTWGYSELGVPGQGLMHSTEIMGYEAGRNFIKNAAVKTAQYYLEAGITSYGADFMSIDKYGLDGAYEANAAANPKDSRWFWNADMWNNYLFYTKALHETTKLPVTLWQLPVGHINGSQEANPYEGGVFKDLTNVAGNYEDSAPVFFFGDTFKPGAGSRFNYFATNESKDPKVKVNGDTITYGSHMEEAVDAGINCILFGAGVGASTDAVGSPASDHYWWITKAQRYYNNPVYLK